jgi:hypothetical protein
VPGRPAHALLFAVTAAVALGYPTSAAAYCRATTCNQNSDGDDACVEDEQSGCTTGGLPLHWGPRCVSYSVQEDGSPLRGISYDLADQIIGSALRKWTTVDCGGQPPTLEFWPTEPVHCNRHEYNDDAPNANLWMFRDGAWPHDDEGWTLALTTITFNVRTGEIYDADVEINSHQHVITTDGADNTSDLASIVTHEAGHVVGLAHSLDSSASMFPAYTPGSTALRTLSDDDRLGVCDSYPADRGVEECDPVPRHGFSTECASSDQGCGCATPGRSRRAWGAALVLAALGAAGWRRRGRGRHR